MFRLLIKDLREPYSHNLFNIQQDQGFRIRGASCYTYYVTKLPVVVKYIQITQNIKSFPTERKHLCSLNLETKI